MSNIVRMQRHPATLVLAAALRGAEARKARLEMARDGAPGAAADILAANPEPEDREGVTDLLIKVANGAVKATAEIDRAAKDVARLERAAGIAVKPSRFLTPADKAGILGFVTDLSKDKARSAEEKRRMLYARFRSVVERIAAEMEPVETVEPETVETVEPETTDAQ